MTEAGGTVVDITSDAAVEGYEGWGGYGSSKAALEQLGNVLAAEHTDLRVYSFDPGDMRTQMHQDAFPGEDISDRPEPEAVAGPPPPRSRVAAQRPLPRCRPAITRMTAAGVDADRLVFELPPALEAGTPAEARGLTRDAVRMLVAHRATGEIEHSTFTMLPTFLDPGDVVVVNTSATIPAAVDAVAADGTSLVVHLSTQVTPDRWVIELRRPTPRHRTLAGAAAPVAVEPRRGGYRVHRGAVRDGRPPVAGPAAAPTSTGLAGLPRPAHSIRLRRAAMAAERVPERLRAGAGQRRDAERRPPVHP